jgi:hypothetical protein
VSGAGKEREEKDILGSLQTSSPCPKSPWVPFGITFIDFLQNPSDIQVFKAKRK